MWDTKQQTIKNKTTMKNKELIEDTILRVAVVAIIIACGLVGSLMGHLLNSNVL